jgi:hypothetical protein
MQIAETILLTEALSNEGLYVNVNVNTIRVNSIIVVGVGIT